MNNNGDKDKYKYTGIYRIKIDKYEYIGQSVNIRRRISEHKRKLANGNHTNIFMQNVFNKYKTFEYKILWKGEKEFLTIMEQICINLSKNNLNLCGAFETRLKTDEQKQSLSEVMKASVKNKINLDRIHSLPKTSNQIEASKKNVWSMNTVEANLKSKLARQNNPNVKKAAQSRADKTVYIFINKKTNLEFEGTRKMFRDYLTKQNVPNVCGRVAEILKGKSFRAWVLREDQVVTFKTKVKQVRRKGSDSTSSDKTIYSFAHTKTNETFIGDRYEFSLHINTTSKQLSGLITLKDMTYHKWKLNSCSLNKPLPI